MDILTLNPAVQHYPWGSVSLIPGLLGLENTENLPFAEIWMGTHPRGMSMAEMDGKLMPLADLIKEDPAGWTGRTSSTADIPFLFKVIGIGSPLSIQCHPDRQQASEGYSKEDLLGIPIDSPRRTYRDLNHKPEILCALTPFTAMCGFRGFPEIEELFRPLELSWFGDVRNSRDLLTRAFELDQAELYQFVRKLEQQRSRKSYALSLKLYRRYGPDPGILAPLYLQVVQLRPGQAIYLEPSELHAYVEGMGMELMANSDNVIRGGLTGKYIDRQELGRVVKYEHRTSSLVEPRILIDGTITYPVPADDFLLRAWHPGEYLSSGERILEIGFCVSGNVEITYMNTRKYTCGCGTAFAVPAGIGRYSMKNTGLVYMASEGFKP